MGWVWKDDVDEGQGHLDSSSPERCSTRRIVKSHCKTEQVEPGKFIRKCEKTEELLRDCVGNLAAWERESFLPKQHKADLKVYFEVQIYGNMFFCANRENGTLIVKHQLISGLNSKAQPVEVVQSNKEYTEEDITNEVVRGGPVTFGSSDRGVLDFPGLRSDIEVMERNLFGGLSRFFDAAEEMKNGFFDVFSNAPRIFDAEPSSSPTTRRGIPVEEYHQHEGSHKPTQKESTDTDFAALAKDV